MEQPLADRAVGPRLGAPSSRAPAAGPVATSRPGPGRATWSWSPARRPSEDLLDGADGGLWVAEADRGRLDPLSGRFVLEVPCARRIRSGAKADPIGRFALVGTVAELVERVVAVGPEAVARGRRLVRQGRPPAAGLGDHAGPAARWGGGGAVLSRVLDALDGAGAAPGRGLRQAGSLPAGGADRRAGRSPRSTGRRGGRCGRATTGAR